PSGVTTVGSATYHWRFHDRSLPALKIWNRYASGATWRTGEALPLTRGVSMKLSGVPDGLGIMGQFTARFGNAEDVQGMVTSPTVGVPARRTVWFPGKVHGP